MVALTDEVQKLTTEYIQRFANLELDVKKIRQDMKELKTEYDEQGLPTAMVIKAYRMMRNEHKLKAKLDELNAFKSCIADCDNIVDLVAQLDTKER